MDINRLKNLIKKNWSKAPSLATQELLALYHKNPRLDGVRIIANKCASVDLYLYDKKELRQNKNNAEIIEDHDIYNLLENPCPTYRDLTGWNVRYFVFACYALVGEAYLLKIRDDKGVPVALLPLSPSWVVTTPTVNNAYWEVYPYGSAGGNAIRVPVEDVISFKDIDLLDPYGRGRGVAEAIGDEVQSDEFAAKYAKNLFYNDATPSAIIYAPGGDKETADQIKQSWKEKMAGLFHSHDIMVMTGENAKFEKIAESPRELDFVESRRYLRDSALQQFHIPPEIVGILESSNRSTIDSAFYLLNKNVLADYLRMYERVMNTQLLWEDFDKERALILRHENTVEEDIDQKLKIANEGLSRGTLTVNDWRRAMGYEIDERGGDVYLRSMATMEIPFNSEPIELPEAPEEDPAEVVELPEAPEEEPAEVVELPEENELSEEEFNSLKSLIAKKYKINKGDDERRKAIWKTFDARATSIEDPFKTAARVAFAKQNEIVNKTIKSALENNKDVMTEIQRVFNKEMHEKFKQTMAGAFLNGLNTGAKFGLENLGKKALGDNNIKASQDEPELPKILQRVFNNWVDTYGLELCTEMDETTVKELRRVLGATIAEGDGLQVQIKKMLEASDKLFYDMSKARAELIARTESCTTMNAGANELYKADGIEQKEWISVQDDRTRDSHLLMDGVVIPIGDKFEVPATSQSEGALMDYPGDATAPAGQVCNCRCTTAPFVKF